MLTEAQKAARIGRITSSVVGAVLGMDAWSSPYDAALRIKGDAVFEGNDATTRGNLLEDACLQYAADKTGLSLRPAPFVGNIAPWSGDSTDALLCDDKGEVVALAEAKTVTGHAMGQWGEEGTDDVPERVLAQCHWHLLHHPGVPTCYVPVLFGGEFVFRLFEVPRNQAFEQAIWQDAKQWHARHIAGDAPVPLSHTDADRQHLLRKSPRDWDEAFVPCDNTLAKLVARRLDAAEAIKQATKEKDLCSNLLRDAIGEHAGVDAASHGFSVTYRKNSDSAVTDWKAVAAACGASEETIYQHTRITPGDRVLRVARKIVRKTKKT